MTMAPNITAAKAAATHRVPKPSTSRSGPKNSIKITPKASGAGMPILSVKNPIVPATP